MTRIHRLSIPTPFLVGRVNCWLIEDDPLTLVDTGPNSGKALDELERGMRDLGHRVEDLQRIVLTHQHMDHLGLAEILARRSGAEVCGIAPLVPYAARFAEESERDDEFAEQVMRRHGIPGDVVIALRSVSRAFRGWGGAVEITHALEDGGTLAFADRTLRVLHRPGHSPTDTVFHDEERGVLIGGDHLLEQISSNPLIARQHEKSLVIYLDSLARTRELELETVLPGHGDDVRDHRALIDSRVQMHERRARKLLSALRDGPRTAHQLAQSLWGSIAVTQAYLTLSEVLGHMDLLIDRGEVRAVDQDGVVLLEAV